MSATSERDRAISLATTNSQKALALARQVSKPWFRCQALAWVARFAPDNEVVKIADEAIAAAFLVEDPYQTVGAAAWPVRALIERGHEQRAVNLLPELLAVCPTIENLVSRLNALFLLWQAVFPLKGDGKKSVLGALVKTCQATNSWQAGYTLRETALILAQEDLIEAKRLVASMPIGVYKRQAERRIAEGQQGYVRSFFWDKG